MIGNIGDESVGGYSTNGTVSTLGTFDLCAAAREEGRQQGRREVLDVVRAREAAIDRDRRALPDQAAETDYVLAYASVQLCDIRGACGDERPAEEKVMTATEQIFSDIANERARPDVIWGGPSNDDRNTGRDWVAFIVARLGKALAADNGPDWRKYMVQAAALAVATIEAHDRLVPNGPKPRAALPAEEA